MLLSGLNLLWFKIGILLSKIVSPLVFALLYISLLLPIAVVMKLAKRDILELDTTPKSSFWKAENINADETHNFRNQY